MHLKNKFFNEIIEIFIKQNYFNYNFLITSFENENYAAILNNFFTKQNLEKNIEIEKYEFFGENITTDEIREIGKLIQNSNLHSYYKFIIIHDVEKILQNSTNTLLKTIEEPNSSTIFFFTTKNIYNILPTIKSRCFNINLDHLETIYNNIYNKQNKKSFKFEIKELNDSDINSLIKKDKNTKDEEVKIEQHIQKNFLEILEDKKIFNQVTRKYEKQIQQIKQFRCNKKHLFNETILKLKLKSTVIK
jgi:DNA polymerase III delta prime subunit